MINDGLKLIRALTKQLWVRASSQCGRQGLLSRTHLASYTFISIPYLVSVLCLVISCQVWATSTWLEDSGWNSQIQIAEIRSTPINIGPNHLRHPELKSERPRPHQGASNKESRGINEETAVRIARRHVTGKVLGVRFRPESGMFMVKMMTRNAKISIVRVDKKTGRVLP